jgi:hypothetical protein
VVPETRESVLFEVRQMALCRNAVCDRDTAFQA